MEKLDVGKECFRGKKLDCLLGMSEPMEEEKVGAVTCEPTL